MRSRLPNLRFLRLLALASALPWIAQAARSEEPAATPTQTPTKARVSVRFELLGGANPTDFKGSLTVEPYLPIRISSPDAAAQVLSFSSPSPLELFLSTGRAWSLRAAGPGWWAGGQILNLRASDQARDVAIPVWPTGKVRGQVQMADRREMLPQEVEAHIEARSPHEAAAPRPWGKVRCPVSKTGAFSCELPGARLDLVFRLEGFIPHYRWESEVSAGQVKDLGTLLLRRGASLVGSVIPLLGDLQPAKCQIRLFSAAPRGGDPQGVGLRWEHSAPSGHPDSRGLFQFGGLAQGQYLLRVEHPGFAPVEIGPIAIESGLETRLREPIWLSPPLTLSLAIEPALDWLGEPWRVEVRQPSAFARPAPLVPDYAGLAGEDGQLEVPGRVVGEYQLTVLDSAGNRFFADEVPVALEPGEPQRRIAIELVVVAGSLARGEEPLPATLWFGGAFGTRRVRFEAGEEGEFEGFLPRGGTWSVEIEPTIGDPVGPRQVEVVPDRKGRAEVAIRLPDTRLFGRVVSGLGGPPAGGAAVIINSDTAPRDVRVGPDGSFSVRGLDAGPVALTAQRKAAGEAWFSEEAQVVVTEGSETGPVVLTLRPARTLSGQVHFQGLVVAGASLAILSSEPRAEAWVRTVTGPDGGFEVRVPSQVSGHRIYVRAQGFPTQTFQVGAEVPVATLELRDEQGELILVTPRPDPRAGALARALLWQGTIEVPPELLRVQPVQPLWVDRLAGGRELRLPGAAAGEYRACWLATAEGQDTASGPCASGQLLPGGRLVLDLTAPQPPR